MRYIVFLLVAQITYAQLAIGKSAPQINVTKWVANAPKDKSLKNKPLLLEFWATWCGPCIMSIPHINDLNDTFKDRIQFVSLSGETYDKVKQFLIKKEMKSAVAIDSTQATLLNFQAQQIPKAVLIDNKGIVQWIGHPIVLTDNMLNDFLQGKPVIDQEQQAIQNIEDKKEEIKYLFKVADLSGIAIQNINKIYTPNRTNIDLSAVNFKDIIYELDEYTPSQLLFKGIVEDQYYTIQYLNTNNLTEKQHNESIITQMMNYLNIKTMLKTEKKTVYVLTSFDTSKVLLFNNGKNMKIDLQNGMWVAQEARIKTIFNQLEKQFGIIVRDEIFNVDGAFNIAFPLSSPEQALKYLKDNYGWEFEVKNRSVKIKEFYK